VQRVFEVEEGLRRALEVVEAEIEVEGVYCILDLPQLHFPRPNQLKQKHLQRMLTHSVAVQMGLVLPLEGELLEIRLPAHLQLQGQREKLELILVPRAVVEVHLQEDYS
jgi:hypothetical protein